MRITQKKENGFYELKEGQEIYGEENGIRLVQIVGQYEDVKEELGIDLLTLFKALTDTIAIKNKDGSIEEMWACPRFQISIDKNDSWILYGPVEEHKYVSIKDYGKTWALTKEELENEKNY